MGALRVTVAGVAFAHLAYHFVLTYSNWESVTRCFSETFDALSEGLQEALWRLGGVPDEHPHRQPVGGDPRAGEEPRPGIH